MRVGRGSIPEMPSHATRPRALPSGEVNLDDTRPGMEFRACSSKWMAKTRAIGDGVASKVEFAPTEEAHEHARSAQFNPIVGVRGLSEDYAIYREMWDHLKGCQPFPGGLTSSQRHVMYTQMACHAYYGVNTSFGGNSWSLEAWLVDVDWSVALAPWSRCQWDKLDAGSEPISGFVNAAQGRHVRSSLEEDDHFETWVIRDSTRRRVTSFAAYDCLVAKGNAARLYPGEFLNDYLGRGEPDVSTEEACGATTTTPRGAVKLSVTGSCTTSGGTLTGTSSGFTPGGTATIRAWYPDGREYTNLIRTARVRADGSIPWSWPCAGDPAGTYSTEAVDDASGATTGKVPFTIGTPNGGDGGGANPAPPATRTIVVDNRVTNGSSQMREDTPAYLSTMTKNFCKRDGCALGGTDVGSGATLTAECTLLGDRTTNGQDNSSIDDGNPGLYSSTRWYGIRWGDGRFGYISEVWIASQHRGGLGLRAC